jgi:hypothetical protein
MSTLEKINQSMGEGKKEQKFDAELEFLKSLWGLGTEEE